MMSLNLLPVPACSAAGWFGPGPGVYAPWTGATNEDEQRARGGYIKLSLREWFRFDPTSLLHHHHRRRRHPTRLEKGINTPCLVLRVGRIHDSGAWKSFPDFCKLSSLYWKYWKLLSLRYRCIMIKPSANRQTMYKVNNVKL